MYPYLQGGLGNQLFVMSAACLLASQTGRRIVVNARQTGVYSYGVPQPTFWQTVFFSDFFHKDQNFVETDTREMSEADFEKAHMNDFEDWSDLSSDVRVTGSFLSFKYYRLYRDFLLELYKPTSELQRLVNDAAMRFQLVSPSGESSTPLSYVDTAYLDSRLPKDDPLKSFEMEQRIPSQHDSSDWSCSPNPGSCTRSIEVLECVSTCERNVAIQIRLQDRSSAADYLNEEKLELIKKFVEKMLTEGRRVVVFSNDPPRAQKLFQISTLSDDQRRRVSFSVELNVIDFYLMSQYFGMHVLTASTFQLWAIFLSPLSNMKIFTWAGTDDRYALQKFLKSSDKHNVTFQDLATYV